jgi:hypothetical protein
MKHGTHAAWLAAILFGLGMSMIGCGGGGSSPSGGSSSGGSSSGGVTDSAVSASGIVDYAANTWTCQVNMSAGSHYTYAVDLSDWHAAEVAAAADRSPMSAAPVGNPMTNGRATSNGSWQKLERSGPTSWHADTGSYVAAVFHDTVTGQPNPRPVTASFAWNPALTSAGTNMWSVVSAGTSVLTLTIKNAGGTTIGTFNFSMVALASSIEVHHWNASDHTLGDLYAKGGKYFALNHEDLCALVIGGIPQGATGIAFSYSKESDGTAIPADQLEPHVDSTAALPVLAFKNAGKVKVHASYTSGGTPGHAHGFVQVN